MKREIKCEKCGSVLVVGKVYLECFNCGYKINVNDYKGSIKNARTFKEHKIEIAYSQMFNSSLSSRRKLLLKLDSKSLISIIDKLLARLRYVDTNIKE